MHTTDRGSITMMQIGWQPESMLLAEAFQPQELCQIRHSIIFITSFHVKCIYETFLWPDRTHMWYVPLVIVRVYPDYACSGDLRTE